MKDQVGDILPQLQQLKEGLQVCGLLNSLHQHPNIWECAFVAGKGIEVTANSLLESFEVLYSDQQMERNTEADVYMYFSDFIHSVHMKGKENLNVPFPFNLTYRSYMYLINLHFDRDS